MYFAQFDYDTEECFLAVVSEEIVIDPDIKFHSDKEQDVVDFCKKWNENEMDKYYVYDNGKGLVGVTMQRQPDYELVDIFSSENEAEKCLLKRIQQNIDKEKANISS